MFSKVTTKKLEKAGFKLESCEDGRFWVIEAEAGAEAERIYRACGRAIIDFDAEDVHDLILIQCDSCLADPALYIDGFMWKLTKRDFADIVFLLSRRQSAGGADPTSRTFRLSTAADRFLLHFRPHKNT